MQKFKKIEKIKGIHYTVIIDAKETENEKV